MNRENFILSVNGVYETILFFFLSLDRLKQIEKTDQSLTLGLEKNKIVISYKPFRIDFYTEDEPVVSINAQGLLKFEHYRIKP